jgi:hypothetical protein
METYFGASYNFERLKENILKDLAQTQAAGNKPYFILSYCWENFPEFYWYDNVTQNIRIILKDLGITDYKFVFPTSFLHNRYPMYTGHIDQSDMIFLEFFALYSFHKIFGDQKKYRSWNYSGELLANPAWNSDSDRALLLLGKIAKLNRMPLLAEFYRANNLSRIDWSLYLNDNIKADARHLVPEFTDKEYEEFIQSVTKRLDPIDVQMQERSSHYWGFPYDVNLYKNTCLSVISETNFMYNQTVWVTEKTYRAIANRHPFVMAAPPGSLKYIETLGFKTFQEYMQITDYDDIEDDKQRSGSIMTNTMHFLDNKHTSIDKINADVEHNYQNLIDFVDREILKLDKVLDSVHNRQDKETSWSLLAQM